MQNLFLDKVFKAVIEIPGIGVTVNFPDFSNVFKNGFWAAIGFFMSFALGILILILVAYTIYAAFKITRSGMEKGLEEGITILKNVYTSIGFGILFFLALLTTYSCTPNLLLSIAYCISAYM
jgi:hypothetical protein